MAFQNKIKKLLIQYNSASLNKPCVFQANNWRDNFISKMSHSIKKDIEK